MDFCINFYADNSRSDIINCVNDEGYEFIEKICKKFNVDARNYKGKNYPRGLTSYQLKIKDIAMIKRIDLFRTRNKLDVAIPPGFLNKYINYNIEGLKRFSLDRSFYISHEVDEKKILDDWLVDGCPLEWRIDNKIKYFKIKYIDRKNKIQFVEGKAKNLIEFIQYHELGYATSYNIYNSIIELEIKEID